MKVKMCVFVPEHGFDFMGANIESLGHKKRGATIQK